MLRVLGLLFLGWGTSTSFAHELTPGYLGLTETSAGAFDVQWKLSTTGGLQNVLRAELPATCTASPVSRYVVGDGEVQRWQLSCPNGLQGNPITIAGLGATRTDVLVRIDYLDGDSLTRRLSGSTDSFVVPEVASAFDVSMSYLGLGIEHILIGIDHLLFVLALLLLVDGMKKLLLTITAFTVAHSITLGAATLGWANVPGAPVEAVIALSILFLASELARRPIDGTPFAPDITSRYPWIVAFSFGLLHGFGFAGALADVGLPDRAIPLALFFFNVGVEIGQLIFIGAVLALGRVIAATSIPVPTTWPRYVAYGIGSLAAFWVFERTLGALGT